MANSISLANGGLYVGLDEFGLVNKLQFPYIGHEDHLPNSPHKIGVWADGQISWLDDGSWTHRSRYPVGALVGHTVMTNDTIGVVLEFEDTVESDANVLIRNVHVINIRDHQRNIRLFFHQGFNIGQYSDKDTAQFVPKHSAIVHYRGRLAFAIGGMTDVGQSADQHAIGLFGQGLDGTWRDAEDGQLSMASAECGQTDSTIGFSLTIGGLSSRRVHYWLVASTSVRAALGSFKSLQKQGVYKRLSSTIDHWSKHFTPVFKASEQCQPAYRKSLIDSSVRLYSHIDRRGAIISDVSRRSHSVCDPEVGALAIWPLIRLGYKQEAMNYFSYVRQLVGEDGYLSLAYKADGSLASTRLPYDDKYGPIDSSQTAINLFVFTQMSALNKRMKLLDDLYPTLVSPMANFLSEFVDDQGLPNVSYEYPSDRKSSTLYTAAVTYAALYAAADMADGKKMQDDAIRWRTAANTLRESAQVFVGERGVLGRSLDDDSSDISGLYGAFMFGLFDIDHPAIAKTVKEIEQNHLSGTDGMFYDRRGRIDYVGSLRMAQYYIETSQQDKAESIIRLVSRVMTSNVAMSHESMSTQTYAEYISTLLDMISGK